MARTARAANGCRAQTQVRERFAPVTMVQGTCSTARTLVVHVGTFPGHAARRGAEEATRDARRAAAGGRLRLSCLSNFCTTAAGALPWTQPTW